MRSEVHPHPNPLPSREREIRFSVLHQGRGEAIERFSLPWREGIRGRGSFLRRDQNEEEPKTDRFLPPASPRAN